MTHILSFLKLPEFYVEYQCNRTASGLPVDLGAFRIAHPTRTDYLQLEILPLIRFASFAEMMNARKCLA